MIYWDHNSSTPCAEEVLEEMLPYFTEKYGNSSSFHDAGRVAAAAVSEARNRIAHTAGTRSESVFFTSGATESNNAALLGVASESNQRRKIVVSCVEHKSVLGPCRRLETAGYIVEVVDVDENGVINIEHAREVIDVHTLIVSIQGASNETGVIQPVQDIAALSHAKGAILHCDLAQALGKIPTTVDESGIDIASLSAHKMYGPKGVGALLVGSDKAKAAMRPILWGGGQERGLRPGTHNTPGIVGFGIAARLVRQELESEMQRLSVLRDTCENMLLKGVPGSWINGRAVNRLPGTLSLTIPGIPADMLMANLPTLCLSNGSACNSGAPEPSHVLLAMLLTREDAESTIRISLGRHTSDSEIERGCEEIITTARILREKLVQ